MKKLNIVIIFIGIGINHITSLPFDNTKSDFDNQFKGIEDSLSKMGNTEHYPFGESHFDGNQRNHRVPNGASERSETVEHNLPIPGSDFLAHNADVNTNKCNVKAFEDQFHKIEDGLLEVAKKVNSISPNESKLSAKPGRDAVVNCQQTNIVEASRDRNFGLGLNFRSSSTVNSQSYSVDNNPNVSDTGSYELAKNLGFAF